MTPTHIAFIMDGNGRWAKSRGLERLDGHRAGVERIRTVIRCAAQAGVKYLTFYAFSTENWGRPQEEVDGLMELFCTAAVAEVPQLNEQGVKVLFVGDKERLSGKVKASLAEAERVTAGNTAITVLIAMNYSGRWEIVQAVKEIAREAAEGNIPPASITEQTVSGHLCTRGVPDPDLLVRTSGEMRVSNFLLWQIAYSEIYVTGACWPDFDEAEFAAALDAYSGRERRFGKL